MCEGEEFAKKDMIYVDGENKEALLETYQKARLGYNYVAIVVKEDQEEAICRIFPSHEKLAINRVEGNVTIVVGDEICSERTGRIAEKKCQTILRSDLVFEQMMLQEAKREDQGGRQKI